MRTALLRSFVRLSPCWPLGVAEAQGNVCTDLEAQLAGIDRGAASGGDPRQYDAPIGQQEKRDRPGDGRGASRRLHGRLPVLQGAARPRSAAS
ncbi:MAG: hypothetical protein WDM84_02935 [Bauldia sp.]